MSYSIATLEPLRSILHLFQVIDFMVKLEREKGLEPSTSTLAKTGKYWKSLNSCSFLKHLSNQIKSPKHSICLGKTSLKAGSISPTRNDLRSLDRKTTITNLSIASPSSMASYSIFTPE